MDQPRSHTHYVIPVLVTGTYLSASDRDCGELGPGNKCRGDVDGADPAWPDEQDETDQPH